MDATLKRSEKAVDGLLNKGKTAMEEFCNMRCGPVQDAVENAASKISKQTATNASSQSTAVILHMQVELFSLENDQGCHLYDAAVVAAQPML